LAAAAAMTSSLLLVTACGKSTPKAAATPQPTAATAASMSPSSTPTPTPAFSDKVPTISDGSDTVLINGQPMKFPSIVTDAVWSPNGARLAYIDGDGNIAVTHLDGTHVQVLTKAVPGVKRTRPVWVEDSTGILFSEQGTDGRWKLRTIGTSASSNRFNTGLAGNVEVQEADFSWGVGGGPTDNHDDTSPTVMTDPPVTNGVGTSTNQVMALQHQGATGPEVWIQDSSGRNSFTQKLLDGSEPAVSSDGKKIAFVGTNGQISVVANTPDQPVDHSAKPMQITFAADHPHNLTWSPDDTRVAFSTPADVESVSASVTAGATSNPAKQESAKPGTASYQSLSRPLIVNQFPVADPVAAAIAAAQRKWTTAKSVEEWGNPYSRRPIGATVVATGSTVEAEEAAARGGGPLFFTSPGKLDQPVADELDRLFGPCVAATLPDLPCGPGNRPTITLVGSTSEIPQGVEDSLKAKGYGTHRVDTADPYSIGTPDPSTTPSSVFVVDAASQASVVTALHAGTVLLTNGSTVPATVQTYLNALDLTGKKNNANGIPVKIYSVGSAATTAMASNWSGKQQTQVTNLVGADDASTALLVAKAGWTALYPPVLAPSLTGPAGISALVIGGGSLLPLDPSNGLTADETALLDQSSIDLKSVTFAGNSSSFLSQITTALGNPVPPIVNVSPKAQP
jgi:hypothetical protein